MACDAPLSYGENVVAHCRLERGHDGLHETEIAKEKVSWEDVYVPPIEVATQNALKACRDASVKMFAFGPSRFTGTQVVSCRTFDGWVDFNLSSFDPGIYDAEVQTAFVEELERRGVLRETKLRKSQKVMYAWVTTAVLAAAMLFAWMWR